MQPEARLRSAQCQPQGLSPSALSPLARRETHLLVLRTQKPGGGQLCLLPGSRLFPLHCPAFHLQKRRHTGRPPPLRPIRDCPDYWGFHGTVYRFPLVWESVRLHNARNVWVLEDKQELSR